MHVGRVHHSMESTYFPAPSRFPEMLYIVLASSHAVLKYTGRKGEERDGTAVLDSSI